MLTNNALLQIPFCPAIFGGAWLELVETTMIVHMSYVLFICNSWRAITGASIGDKISFDCSIIMCFRICNLAIYEIII